MSRRISEFFHLDLLEEQHKWSIDQMAFFYQTSEEEVITALAKANERYADNPLSVNYCDPEFDIDGCSSPEVLTPPCGDVQCPPGEGGAQGRPVVASGGCPP